MSMWRKAMASRPTAITVAKSNGKSSANSAEVRRRRAWRARSCAEGMFFPGAGLRCFACLTWLRSPCAATASSRDRHKARGTICSRVPPACPL